MVMAMVKNPQGLAFQGIHHHQRTRRQQDHDDRDHRQERYRPPRVPISSRAI